VTHASSYLNASAAAYIWWKSITTSLSTVEQGH